MAARRKLVNEIGTTTEESAPSTIRDRPKQPLPHSPSLSNQSHSTN